MVPITGLDRASSFDIHYSERYVYFSTSSTQSQSRKIQRAKILEETLQPEDFVTRGIDKVTNSGRVFYLNKFIWILT